MLRIVLRTQIQSSSPRFVPMADLPDGKTFEETRHQAVCFALRPQED